MALQKSTAHLADFQKLVTRSRRRRSRGQTESRSCRKTCRRKSRQVLCQASNLRTRMSNNSAIHEALGSKSSRFEDQRFSRNPKMAGNGLRLMAATFTLLILLSVSLTSFELDLNVRSGASGSRNMKNFFADAAPLRDDAVSKLTDAMDDVDLYTDGKEQHDREITDQQKELTESHREEEEKQPQSKIEAQIEVREEESAVNNDAKQNEQKHDAGVNTQSEKTEMESNPEPAANNDSPMMETESKSDDEPPTNAPLTPPGEQHDETGGVSTLNKRRTRAKTFLVVFMGHSGSTAFTTELRTHSEFLVKLLEPLEHGEFEFDTEKALARARELMDRGIEQGKIPGFKIRPFHISNKPELWREFVKEYDTRIIWQYRENIIKQAVGEYRNRVLNDSSVVEGLMLGDEPCQKGSGQICKFKIEDLSVLHRLMNDFSTSDELLTKAVRTFRRDNEMHVVRYEDYLYSREKTMRSAFDFFGVDYQDTKPGRQKASPDSLCDMVINFQDLCDRFVQCQLWRPYLTDDKNDCRCEPGRWQPFDPSFCHRDAWFQKRV